MAKGKGIGIGKLKRDLKRLAEMDITVGFQGRSGSKRHPNGTASVAEVARYMEFGTDDIPARPFLRTTEKQHKGELKKVNRRALADLVDQRADVDQVAAKVGEAAVEAVRDTIDSASMWAEPLKRSTVKRKGHSRPLVDTETMRDNVSWAARENGQIKSQGGEK